MVKPKDRVCTFSENNRMVLEARTRCVSHFQLEHFHLNPPEVPGTLGSDFGVDVGLLSTQPIRVFPLFSLDIRESRS